MRVRRRIECAHRDADEVLVDRVPEQRGAAGRAEAALHLLGRAEPGDVEFALDLERLCAARRWTPSSARRSCGTGCNGRRPAASARPRPGTSRRRRDRNPCAWCIPPAYCVILATSFTGEQAMKRILKWIALAIPVLLLAWFFRGVLPLRQRLLESGSRHACASGQGHRLLRLRPRGRAEARGHRKARRREPARSS